MKKCTITIAYCNSQCPHFYHSYDDNENIYCSNLDKKIFDCGEDDDAIFDHTERQIPSVCPLEDA